MLLLFFTFSYKPRWSYNWSQIRDRVKDSVILIDDYGGIPSKYHSFSGKTPRQWHRINWLKNNATDYELTRLIEYPDGAVKATAFETLIKRDKSDNFQLLLKAFSDTTTFFYSSTSGDTKMVGEYLIEDARLYEYIFSYYVHENIDCLGLTKTELNEVNELYKKRKELKLHYFKNYFDMRY